MASYFRKRILQCTFTILLTSTVSAAQAPSEMFCRIRLPLPPVKQESFLPSKTESSPCGLHSRAV